ncbi:lymphocyte activation gene 3 protein-like [Embiotoca jacksoni]|uniref:lymphocyte activation gene 3 protein-like n=1 Tax=Embiotoca jacksoni TaxID=100190 RepID=UPI003704796B
MLMECFIFGVLMTGVTCDVTEVLAKAGSQAVLPCKSGTSSPVAIVWSKVNTGTVWRKQKSGLQYWGSRWSRKGVSRVQCPHSQFERGDYSLQMISLREEDGGLYSCKVEVGDEVTENLVLLRIIKVSISPSVPIWGSNVAVTCNVTPWRDGASVQWLLNNSPFVPQSGISSIRAGSVVKKKATAGVTGDWTCVVGYQGKEGRASATLSVRGIIQPSRDNTKVYAVVGSAVTLPCVFSSGLSPSGSVWEKQKTGSLFKHVPSLSASSSSAQLPWDKSASLNEVGFGDAGEYRCAGTIEDQKITRNMQLVVAKIVSEKKKDSMTLTCQLTDTSEITEYEWLQVIYDLNGTESVGPVLKGKTLIISKVSEEKWGEWTCRFYGKEGILGNITYHAHQMSGLSGHKSSGVSHNTATVVGLSFFLLVLLLVLAQMYKNHRRRKRIFQFPALETIVHTVSNEQEERKRNQVKK